MNGKGVVCFGELVMDMFGSMDEGFRPHFGGAPGNVAIGLTRLHETGVKPVRMVSFIGDDMFGQMLMRELESSGVDVSNVFTLHGHATTLAFVSNDARGERSFSFLPGLLKTARLPYLEETSAFDGVGAMLCGSIYPMMNDSGLQSFSIRMLDIALRAGVMTYLDPNIRLALFPKSQHQLIRGTVSYLMSQVHVVKVSIEEAQFLLDDPSGDPDHLMDKLWKLFGVRTRLCVMTLGADGAMWSTREGNGFRMRGHEPGLAVDVVDTTGAGDAFNAGLLSLLVGARPVDLWPEDDIAFAVRFACACASLTCRAHGATAAFPSRSEVLEHMKG